MSLSEAGAKLLEWRERPRQFVEEVFGVAPDAWQAEVLDAFPHRERIAMKACKGPGKTAVEAWLLWNFMVTRPRPKCAATSISRDNLRDNLWAELAKWQGRSGLLKTCFTWTQAQIANRECPAESFISARSWPKTGSRDEQANTLAGLHADYILFVLDELGGIPDAVMVSADAALSSCVEGHVVQAGNPTHLEGPLYRACTLDGDLWFVVEITGDPDDPKRSSRVRADWARQQIRSYGRDNPWVLVNVFGKFPPSSFNTLIGPDEVREATTRIYRAADIEGAARVAGIDVARFGDDASVLFPRQGLQAFAPRVWRNLDGVQGAGAVARFWREHDLDACFIDDTGGYGASWIDQLRVLNRSPIGVGFASRPNDPRYENKRAEMYVEAAQWIKAGGALPECPELQGALTQTTYAFKGDRLLIEPKDAIKARLGYSPDHADAFVLTFAHPAQRRRAAMVPGAGGEGKPGVVAVEYDPHAEV